MKSASPRARPEAVDARRPGGRRPRAVPAGHCSSASSSTTSQTSSKRPSTSFSVRISRATCESPPRSSGRCRSGRGCRPSGGGSPRGSGRGARDERDGARRSGRACRTRTGRRRRGRTRATSGWARSPSIVVTSRPASRWASVMQASAGAPSTSTVQAPQWPSLQATFVPVSPISSRSSLRERGPSPAASSSWRSPLTTSSGTRERLDVGDVDQAACRGGRR